MRHDISIGNGDETLRKSGQPSAMQTLDSRQPEGFQYTPYEDIQEEEERSPGDDDDYLAKERELRELNDLRIRTLERLVREKVDIVNAQESELG